MNKLRESHGMTMMEMLIVVAITVILCGVSFVAVQNYQRSLGQLERDGIAQEIFIAAQNHLTAAFGEGYLGTTDFGIFEPDIPGIGDSGNSEEGTDIYCYIVNGSFLENSVLGQMLPFGSIDEAIRGGGSYIVRYQKDTGMVLDVFYCTINASPTQYNHHLVRDDYSDILDLRDKDGANHKQERRNWEDGAILGWYGGEAAAKLAKIRLEASSIVVHNEEKLYVEVSNPNSEAAASLMLIVTGVKSNAKTYYKLGQGASESRVINHRYDNGFTVILDDVARWGSGDYDGFHFGNIEAKTKDTSGESFIPGEDITVQAVAYSNSALANLGYSAKVTTNSLFAGITSINNNNIMDKALIGNIRHLENLDRVISNLSEIDSSKGISIKIKAAEQISDLSWTNFQKRICRIETKSATGTEDEEDEDGYEYESVRVYALNGTPSAAGCYMPIEPDYVLSYDGKNHSISDITVNAGEAGLFGDTDFGNTATVSAISNLELIDFNIKGTVSAGALAGTLSNCTVTNVLARKGTIAAGTSSSGTGGDGTSSGDGSTSSSDEHSTDITEPVAGGLIGRTEGSTSVRYCAAALIVNGSSSGFGGGLIGEAEGTEISHCYSGGHTKNGSYKEWVSGEGGSYDVTGGTVGGLVGSFSGSTIADSYSTCSVSGSLAGGFAGSATGSISNCYATGLVGGGTAFAFLGSGDASLRENYYYSVINEIKKENGTDDETESETEDETELMLPMDGYDLEDDIYNIQPLDLNAETYNTFVGGWDSWNPARPFDSALISYYGGKYTLRTVDELNDALPEESEGGYSNWNQLYVRSHHGDWPSPEVFFINQSIN